MDIARSDQILADVKQATLVGLASRFGSSHLIDSQQAADCYDRTIRDILMDTLLGHHEDLWPSSNLVENSHQLIFGGTTFAIATGSNVWEPAVLELAYVPSDATQRIESRFGTDFPLAPCGRYTSIRLYPPRMSFAFEFQQQLVVDIVQCILETGQRWINKREAS